MQSNPTLLPLVRPLLPRAIFIFSICLTLVVALPAPAPAAPAPRSKPITHIVIFWLKRPGNKQDQARLARATESFRGMPGLLRVEVGRSLPVRRVGIEQAFDLCAVFTFQNQAALARFEKDPRHLQAVESTLKPLVRRYSVFNALLD